MTWTRPVSARMSRRRCGSSRLMGWSVRLKRSAVRLDLVRRALRLPPSEWVGVLRAAAGLLLVDLHLRRRGFRDTARLDVPAGEIGTLSSAAWQQARRYVRWIDAAALALPIQARCLHRSLLLQRWLLRDGLPAALCIGVSRPGRPFLAHAWIELHGVVVNDTAANIADFAPLTGPAMSADGAVTPAVPLFVGVGQPA
ncbi:MAG: lasso peptide biosynthesis B2 protein [Chloroflexi bacterium]|nr:lasso peptide biosynthesis B2 protein [Chloroflexota bacterium]